MWPVRLQYLHIKQYLTRVQQGWRDIIQVAAGSDHTVGLKDSSAVVAVGYKYGTWCDFGDWTEIKQIAAGGAHTVGLEDGGTVVAVGTSGWINDGQYNVGGWTLK